MAQDQTSAPQQVIADVLSQSQSSDETSPAPAAAPAPGPAQAARQSMNPVLASVAPPKGAAGEGGEKESGLGGLVEAAHSAHDYYEFNNSLNIATEASAGSPTILKSMEKFGEASEAAEKASPVMSGVGKLMAPVDAALGILDTGKAVADISQNGANPTNVKSGVEGALDATSGFLTSTGVGAPAAAVMTSASMGLKAGDALAKHAEKSGNMNNVVSDAQAGKAAFGGGLFGDMAAISNAGTSAVIGGIKDIPGAIASIPGAMHMSDKEKHNLEVDATSGVVDKLGAQMRPGSGIAQGEQAGPINFHDLEHHLDNVPMSQGGTMAPLQILPADVDSGQSPAAQESVSSTPVTPRNYPAS